MQALFEIKKCFPNVHKPRPHGELRQFFIAAEEEVWDYAPTAPSERLVNPHASRHVDVLRTATTTSCAFLRTARQKPL